MAKKTEKSFNKKWFYIGIPIFIAFILILWLAGTYNALISADQNVKRSWADVETQYQRRIDLIPNLVNSVKGYMTFEKDLLTKITDLRTQWMSSATAEDRVNTANQIEAALKTIFAVSENYPDLKADNTVISMMDELAGTENRISVARMKYNEAIMQYNNLVKFVPSNVIAGWMGMKEKTPFQAVSGAEKAPVVNIG